MTTTFVGFGDPNGGIAVDVVHGASGSFTVDLPSGYAAGDLLMLMLYQVEYVPGESSIDVPGWTQVATETSVADTSGGEPGGKSRLELWKRISDGGEGTSVTVNYTNGSSLPGQYMGHTAAVTCPNVADPLDRTMVTSVSLAAGVTPNGAQTTAEGFFVGFVVAVNDGNGAILTSPGGWPCLSDGVPAPSFYPLKGWCTDPLSGGPVALGPMPVSFTIENNTTHVAKTAQWQYVTVWVSNNATCGEEPINGCVILPASDASHPGALVETSRTGYCAPDGYVLLEDDGDYVEWSFLLDASTAAALTSFGSFWLRAYLAVSGDFFADNPGLGQMSITINGVTADYLIAPNYPSSDPPDPSQWAAANTLNNGFLTPDELGPLVEGVNTIRVTLVDRSVDYISAGPKTSVIDTVYIDELILGTDLTVSFVGEQACAVCSELSLSTTEQCVRVLDFPPNGGGTGGTISGRPALLCASYGVMVIDRRNRATVLRMPELGWDLEFNRRVDRTSDAELTVYLGQGPGARAGVDAECCASLSKVGEWMHELVVWREDNPIEQWGGPITGVSDQPGSGVWTCTAHDRSVWWDERALPYDLIYTGSGKADAAKVFTDLVRAADQPRSHLGVSNTGGQVLPYDPVGLEIFAHPTGVIVDQKVLLRADDVVIGGEIRSLSDSVLDWTVLGRRCYAGALVLDLEPIPILTTDHWLEQDPQIVRDGIGVATKVVVRGAGDVRGEYPPGQVVNPRWTQYGSHFKLIKDSSITDTAVATSRARTYWERWQQPNFTVVSNSGTLGPKAPVTVEDLIPGRAVQVAVLAGCMPTSLRLGETRSGAGRQFFAYDSGQVQPLIVPQRIFEVSVRVEDSLETEVRIDTQALGTDARTRGRINYSSAGIGEG